MRSLNLVLASLLGLAVLVGCASSDVTARRQASGAQDVASSRRLSMAAPGKWLAAREWGARAGVGLPAGVYAGHALA